MKNYICVSGTFRLGFQYHHIKLLQWIEDQFFGNLIILTNTNESIRKIKPNAFVLPQNEREFMMSYHKYVQDVIFFDEENPVEILKIIQPKYYVKGGDYKIEDLLEAEIVQNYGGQVIIAPKFEGSTTDLEKDICDFYSDESEQPNYCKYC